MRLAVLLGFVLAARVVLGAGVTVGDGFSFCPAGPALEQHPSDPDRVLALCELFPGVFPIDVEPGSSMRFTGPDYLLPANLDCSASGGGSPRLGNLWVEDASRAWLTSTDCELVVPFAVATGADWNVVYDGDARRSVPTERTITGAFTVYVDGGGGGAVASFDTRFTSDVARVGGRLLVAMSNFKKTGSAPELYPGTVLLFDIDDGGPVTTVTPASPPYVITQDPNPTALTVLPGGRVAVTNTGLLDVAFPPLVTGPGSIDIIDPALGTIVGSIPLSPNPGGRRLALDPTGSVGVAASHSERLLFAVDLRAVDDLPDPGIDPTQQRPSCHDVATPEAGGVPCLRARAIRGTSDPLLFDPPLGSSGFVPEVRFAPSGDYVAATSFNDGELALVAFDPRNLDAPHPLLSSRFGAVLTDDAGAPPVFGGECCPGPLVFHPDAASGLAGAPLAWLTAQPVGVLVRGTLSGPLPEANGDVDADLWDDAIDNCPLASNGNQLDRGGVATSVVDGIGDVCQCGDVNGSGIVDAADAAALRSELAGLSVPAFPQKCDVSGDGLCDEVDVARVSRGAQALGPALVQSCAPAVP